MNKVLVLIFTQQEGEPQCCIGQVAVNSNLIDANQPDELLADLWSEWRGEVEYPDSDSEFIDWLVANKRGFSRSDMSVMHTVIKC